MKYEHNNIYPDGRVFVPFYLSSIDPSSQVTQYMQLIIEKPYNNVAFIALVGDKDPATPEYFKNKANIVSYTDWMFVAIAFSNNNAVGGFGYLRTAYNFIETVNLQKSQNWNIPSLSLRLMSNIEQPTYYFPGKITKMDFWGDFFITSGTRLDYLIHGLPKLDLILDFTDPEYTQEFKNRAKSGYNATLRGIHNHTDVQDIFFNPTHGFSMRHFSQLIYLPKFVDTIESNYNSIVHYKFKGWGLNNWNAGATRFYIYQRLPAGSKNWLYGLAINKVNYATSMRGEVKTYYHRHACNFYTSPNTHLAYTQEYGMAWHFFVSHLEQKATNFYSCNGYIGGMYANGDPKLLVNQDDYFIGGYEFDPNKKFNEMPFHQSGYLTVMDLEVVLQLLIVTKNGYKSNPYSQYPNACSDNTIEQYGPGDDGYKIMCATDYSPYHEANLCIRDPISSDFMDCKHDMDSVGGKCYRCPRYYGKVGTEGCFKCYDNCIECTGGQPDQCIYCGIGYGFTGTSCEKCADDQTWDLSKNLCQKKKVKFLEADYGYKTFGEIVLMFIPLNGVADLSLYTENMWDRYWITDINDQYYLIRRYENLPLHRKVSVSFEFIMIDGRTFGYLWAAIDKEYYWGWSPNLEDTSIHCDLSYWGYSYLDSIPYKIAYTNFHSASTMEFGIAAEWQYDWNNIWFRELNVTFFGCYEACKTCWEDNSPVHCTSCLDGYYLIGAECKTCDPVCNTCEGTANNCRSCPNGEFLKVSKCFVTCGLGWFADTTDNNNCKECPIQCVQCNSLTSCNSCKNGYFLSTDKCLSCDSNCVTCTSASTKCLSCASTLYLRNFECVAACGDGFYEVTGKICNQCPPGCTTCTASECLTCDSGFKKKGSVCADPCGVGWYDAGVDCQQCDSQCETCITSSSNCLSCKTGRALDPPDCTQCQDPCVTCGVTPTECTSCQGTKFLSGITCIDSTSCPLGTLARNNLCEDCDPPCKSCMSLPNFCISCESPRILSGSSCLEFCPDKYHQVGTICCPNECSSCTDSSTCTSCNPGYFINGITCLQCDLSCTTCEETSTKCLTCGIASFFEGNKCLPKCSDGFYPLDGACLPCDASCATCTGPLTIDCLTCVKAHILWEGICQDCTNPSNKYFSAIDNVCWDKCGSGNRFSTLELKGLGGYNACDDGNLVNGDGCSADCRIEKNFRCEGGSTSAPDKCFSTIKPIASVLQIYRDKYQIQFSHAVYLRDSNLTKYSPSEVISLSILNYNSSDFNFTTSMPAADPILYFNLSLAFKKSVDSILTINLVRELINDENNNTLKNSRLVANASYLIPSRFVLEESFNYTTTGFSVVNYGTPPLSVSMTNYVTQSFMRAVLSFQLVKSTSLINVMRSSELDWVLGGVSNTSRTDIKSPFLFISEKLTGDSFTKEGIPDPSPPNTLQRRTLSETSSEYTAIFSTDKSIGKFKDLKFSTAITANLSFTCLLILFGGFWYMFTNIFCDGCISRRSNCFVRFIYFSGERFFYSAVILSTLELSIFSTYNLMNPELGTLAGQLSFALAVISMVLILTLPLSIYKISSADYMTLWHPDHYAKYGYLYCEFKLNKKVILK